MDTCPLVEAGTKPEADTETETASLASGNEDSP